MDVGFFEDDKIQLIEAEFGVKGTIVAIRLLCKVYKNGYFYQWGGDECLLLSKQIGDGIVPNLVEEIVKGLVRRSFFDKGVFDSFRILTSRSIQRRYLEAVGRTRTDVVLNPEIDLVHGFPQENAGFQQENAGFPQENAINESKEKESKAEKNKGDGNARADKHDYGNYVEFYIDSLKNDHLKKIGIVNSIPDCISIENFDTMIEKFRSWMLLTERNPVSYGSMINTFMNWLRIEHKENLKLENVKNNQNYGKSGKIGIMHASAEFAEAETDEKKEHFYNPV